MTGCATPPTRLLSARQDCDFVLSGTEVSVEMMYGVSEFPLPSPSGVQSIQGSEKNTKGVIDIMGSMTMTEIEFRCPQKVAIAP